MSNTTTFLLTALAAYLIGSIPFSLMIGRIFGGIDLRDQGSGNIGATNVARTMGAKWGALALLCDASKGMIAVGIVPQLLPVAPENAIHQQVVAAIVAVVGHMFPIFLKFRGGKGVATALGGVVILSPLVTLIAFVVFLCIFFATRMVSLCSLVAAIVFAIAQFALYWNEMWSPQGWTLAVFSILVPLLIIARHHSNIGRIIRGEEPKFAFRRPRPDSNPASGEVASDPDNSAAI